MDDIYVACLAKNRQLKTIQLCLMMFACRHVEELEQ